MDSLKGRDASAIAITGLSCRLPGDCESPQLFWESICSGKSAWSEVPASRWKAGGFWSATKKRNTAISKSGHFIKQDVSSFDASFFGISSAEAAAMDPQHRLMTEVAYEAAESAGLSLQALQGSKTGVWMGQFTSDYKEMLYRDTDGASPYAATGLQVTSLANRLSWLWDLRGPSLTLDTACSSSLVALHLACESLRSGESDMAIVGGCNLMLGPEVFIFFGGQGFLSPDGKSKAFDVSADGYGRGEGFAAVVLRRAQDAISNGDPIRAVIRGTACNQDGHTKGFTQPSSEAQASLITQVYAQAKLGFEATGYVEAHGTGTQTGDLQETMAISQTLSSCRSAANKLLIGSVKTNIGHLEAAAGLAAVIKSVLILEHGMIPANIHFKTPNPKIPFDDWNIKVPTALVPFPSSKAANGVRRISVNSFGYGGTNAHAIIDDAASYLKSLGVDGGLHFTKVARGSQPALENDSSLARESGKLSYRLYPITSQSRDGLKRTKKALATYLGSKSITSMTENEQASFLRDLSFTLSKRRSLLQWKTYAVASPSSTDDLAKVLDKQDAMVPETLSSRMPRLGFVFTGQGAQWPAMGMELFGAYDVFRKSVEAADAYLKNELGCKWSVIEELGEAAKAESKVGAAEYSQPLCTILQVALVDLLKEWNVVPKSVTGHSSGEIAAAYCMGALSCEAAWRVAYYRGTLATALKNSAPDIDGAMLALGLGSEAATAMIASAQAEAQVCVACVNSPTSVTISGDAAGIEKILAAAEKEGVFARKLQVDTAYHSFHMQLVSQDYMESLHDLTVDANAAKSGIRMHTSVTGASVQDPDELGPSHWVKNLISPVQFSSAIQDLVRPLTGGSNRRPRENAVDVLVEIGPHSALRGPSLQSLQAIGVTNVPYFSALTRNEDAVQTALGLAGTLFSHGVPLDFAAVNQDKSFKRPPRTLVHLPPYQWNHSQKYWAESRLAREFRLRDNGARSLIGAPLPATSARERIWRGFLRLEEQPWVGHHKINDSILYPAAGFIAMVVEGLRQLLFYDTTQKHRTLSGFRLRDVQLVSPMLVSSEMSGVEYILSLQPEQEEGSYRFAVASCGDGQSLSNNCTGTAMVEYEGAEPVLSAEQAESTSAFKAAASSCKHAVDPARFYETLRQAGFDYGPCFSNVVSLSCKPNTSVGTVVVPDVGFTPADTNSMPEELYKNRPHIVHPTFLDAVLHLCFAALMGDGNKMTRPMVPTHFDEIHLSTKLPIHVGKHLRGFSHARMAGLKTLLADVAIMDEQESMPVLTIRGLSCSEIDSATSRAVGTGLPNTKRYVSQMVWRPHLQLLSGQHLNSWMQSKAKTVHEVLAVYIKLLHHIRPSVTLLEFTPASEASQTLLSSLVKLGIAPLLNTAKYTVCTTGTPALDNIKEFLQSISDIPEESLQAIELDLLSGKPQDDAVEPAAPLLADMVIATDLLAKGIEQAKELVQKLAGHLSNEGKLLVVQKDAGHVSDLKEIAHQAGLFVEAELRATEGVLIVLKAMYAVNGHQNINGIKPIPEMPVTLLACPSASQAAKGFFQELCQFLSSAGFAPSIVSWDPAQLESLKDKVVLSLLEIERPFWRDLAAAPEGTSEDNFLAARDLMTLAQSVTWVTGFADPAAEMVTGIARVVRNETPGLSFRTIHIYDSLDSRAAELLSKAFSLRGSTQPDDAEFRIDQGVVQVNRVSVDLDADNMMKDLVSADKGGTTRPLDKVELGSLAKDSCLRLAVEAAGGLDSLQFVEEQAMAEDEVEIVVKASCLSETDLATVKGQNRLDPNLLGTGASGVVSRIDSKSNPGKLRVGDRVMVLTPGAHRTLLRTKASHVGKIPASLSFKDTACIPLAFTTAWYALVYLGRLTSLEKGKTCLIHDALSTVGRQAVYIARLLGLQISVTVDSPSQANYAAGVLGVDLSHTVLLSSTTVFDLSRVVRELTPDRRGVDLVIDCSGTLTGEALRQTMGALAPFAHFIRCPTSDGSPASSAAAASAGAAFGAIASSTNVNRTMSSVDIALLLRSQPDALAPMIQQAFQFFYENGCHVSGGVESFPVSSVAAAFRRVEAGSVESITLTYSDEDVVPARLRPQLLDHSAGPSRGVALDPNSIYVLSGGLGGLGRSLSTFMVEKLGARKILFLSRSGAASSSARQLLADLEASKTRPAVAAYPCDVSDREALAQSLSKAEAEMGGQIKGVIQCAMVLRDVLWSHMSYKQWVESTLPKVQGTENLSTLLPDVDFFISLSSFAGVFGNRGQANYAAGNCYQDALARHRRQVLGLKSGLTIDVPSMQGIGVLAETGMLESLREWDEVYGMDEAEFHHVMGLAIRRDMTKEGTLEAKQQLILGIATGGSAHAAGIQIPYYLESEAKFSIMEKTDMVFLGGAPNSQSASTDQPKDKSIKDILVKAADMDEASDAITKALIARVAGMQRVAVGEVDASRYLHSYGVDSLAAIDIANWALKEVGSKISVCDVMAAMPITALAEKCAARSNFVPRELKELGGS
ncbi:Type I Iterative PKS [Pyricularia oryzae]|nr:Type I Iterative PKS [Pyricularia oryzae]KAI6342545.1 Type I Iterative PKS [Pyricularia oryzae]KAI6407785.1 Type I Iterative PKS [Pyricularia oryzae]KAI6430962.1 Type I Iterative PKS [Pyricularia oryzae]KAI6432513.1 Type I Iterative PKS [Pyricularia oryzae]